MRNFIFGGITGVVVGFVGGYAISYFREKKIFEKRVKDEYDAMKARIERLDELKCTAEAPVEKKPEPAKESPSEPEKNVTKEISSIINDSQEASDKNDATSYFKIVKSLYAKPKIEEVEEDDDDEDEDAVLEIETAEEKLTKILEANPYQDKPYMITWDAYHDPDDIHYRGDYQHIELDYFLGDNVIAYSEAPYTPLGKEDDTIGAIWRTAFGNYDDYAYEDDQVVYVRNDKLRTDYAISKDANSYIEFIAGLSGKGGDDNEH